MAKLILSYYFISILTLAAALSPTDREVFAYLISYSNRGNTQKAPEKYKKDHPRFSPVTVSGTTPATGSGGRRQQNRQLIHEIIDDFEDGLAKSRRGKGKRGGGGVESLSQLGSSWAIQPPLTRSGRQVESSSGTLMMEKLKLTAVAVVMTWQGRG